MVTPNPLQQILLNFHVLAGLHLLPDSAALTTDEAAIFLRLSRSSLERMRKDGSGPTYIQGGAKGAPGTNQKVTYLKGDLLKYQQGMKVENSMDAAMRRGQAYLPYVDPTPRRSMFDLVTRRAFYLDTNKKLAGCVLETPIGTVIERLGSWAYAWYGPLHAVQMDWSSPSLFNEFASSVRFSLEAAIDRLDAGVRDNSSSPKGSITRLTDDEMKLKSE